MRRNVSRMSDRNGAPGSFWRNLATGRPVPDRDEAAFKEWAHRFARHTGVGLADRLLAPIAPSGGALFPADVVARDRLLLRLRDARYAEVVDRLADAGVRTVALAGYASDALLYGAGGWRLIGDLDLLVAPRQLETAVARLQRHGFRFRKAKSGPFGSLYRGSLPPFVSRDRVVNLDLHVAADMALPEPALPVCQVFDRATPDSRGSGLLPAPEHHLLILAAKAIRDRFEGEAVRKFVDIVLQVEAHKAVLDWDEVATRAKAGQLDRPLRVLLALHASLVGENDHVPADLRRPPRTVPSPAFRRLVASWRDLTVPWSADCGVARKLASEWAYAANFRVAMRRDLERLWNVMPFARQDARPVGRRGPGGVKREP